MLHTLHALAAWSPLGVPAFLFVITLVIFFHELGHYSVARAFGVKVDVFSIGFGREIFGWTARSGTRWKIALIPLGGYVRFFGDADAASTPDRAGAAQMSAQERAGALQFKPLWQRALVVVAGPVANFVLAIVIIAGLLMAVGRVVVPSRVGAVQPGSAAAAAGIEPGDVITRIDGQAVTSYEELQQIVSVSANRRIALVEDRAGRNLTLWVTPHSVEVTDRFENHYKIGQLGVVSQKGGTLVRYGPVGAVRAAANEIWFMLDTTIRAPRQVISGNTSQISGVIGIAKLSGDVASIGFLPLLNLVALISVSVGLVNLFPIPLLDGGHLLYYGCEAVLGRPLGERAQDIGFRLGLAFVLGLMLLATWNDLIRLNLF
jgi:regulator of sigma E protease